VRRCQGGRSGGDVRVGSQLRRGSADLHVQLAGIERFSSMLSAPVRWPHCSPMTPRRCPNAGPATSPDIRGKVVNELMIATVMRGRRGSRTFDRPRPKSIDAE
jgi:hypothetical protein